MRPKVLYDRVLFSRLPGLFRRVVALPMPEPVRLLPAATLAALLDRMPIRRTCSLFVIGFLVLFAVSSSYLLFKFTVDFICFDVIERTCHCPIGNFFLVVE